MSNLLHNVFLLATTVRLCFRYPAGHLYVFAALYKLTNRGLDIRLAQYIFVGFYILNLAIVLRIYAHCKRVSSYATCVALDNSTCRLFSGSTSCVGIHELPFVSCSLDLPASAIQRSLSGDGVIRVRVAHAQQSLHYGLHSVQV